MKTNIVKNIVIVVILTLCYPIVQSEFATVKDIETIRTLMLFVGLIIVAPLFAAFGFTYEKVNSDARGEVITAHVTAFLHMLVIGLLCEMVDVLFVILVGNIVIFRITLLMFYIGVITYDFWDLFRNRALMKQ